MFSAYFTTSYFPDGWGAVGALPEGSMSGGTTFRISAAATAITSGTSGSASFSIGGTGTLTFIGHLELLGGGRITRRRSIGWLRGAAAARVEAQARPGATITATGTAHLQVAASGAMTRMFLVSVVEPVATAPARVTVHQVQPAETPAPQPVTFPAWVSGTASLSIEATGTLSSVLLPPEVVVEDDSDTIALLLALLEAA